MALVAVIVFHAAVAITFLCLHVQAKPEPETLMVISMLMPEPLRMRPAEPVKPKVKLVEPPKPQPQPKVALPVPQPVAKVVEARPADVPVPIAQPAPVTPAPVKEAPKPELVPEPTAPRFNVEGLQNPEPSYPPLSRRMGEEGKVTLRVFVTPEGLAGEVQLAKSSSFSRLDQAALATVKQWHFKPAQLGNDKVAAWVLVPIIFTLEN